MNDKDLLEDILLTVKGAADLYLHATIEASTTNVKNTFHEALHEVLKCQENIYNKMAQKGWYPQEQAQQQQIDKVKQKYAGQ